MRRIASHVLAAVVLAGLLQATTRAQDTSDIVGLRAEVEQLRREVNTGLASGYDQDKKPVPAPAGGPAGGGSGGCSSCGGGDSCGACNTCGCNSCSCDTCGCNSACGCCNTCGCENCCRSGVWASAELMWFKYHRADGARVSNETARNGDD